MIGKFGWYLRPLLLVFVLALPFGTAWAQGLDQYRTSGEIAERYDGYVEIRVGTASKEARETVREVNDKRRNIYRARAEDQGVAPEAVAKVYAKQIIEDAPKGTYFLKPDGSYVRK
mgnify:CR=1 FL=1